LNEIQAQSAIAQQQKIPADILSYPMRIAQHFLQGCKYVNKTRGPMFLDPRRSLWVYEPAEEYNMLIEMITCRVPFAFSRFSDGEYYLMIGNAITNNTQAKQVDRWDWKGGIGKCGRDIKLCLADPYPTGIHIHAMVFPHGFRHGLEWMLNISTRTTQFLSYAHVWAGSRFSKFKLWMDEVVTAGKLEQPIIVVCNEDVYPRRDVVLKWAIDIIYFPDDGPNWWEVEGDRVAKYYANIARSYNGVLFLFSIGPPAEAVIYHMYKANVNNQYIAVGSPLEQWTKGKLTRSYGNDATYDKYEVYKRDDNGKLVYTPRPSN